MEDLTIVRENGEAEISIKNILNNEVQHGQIVGVIHRIDPRRMQSSLVFYRDGFVHEALGLASGVKENKVGALALACVVHRIPFLSSRITQEQIINNTIPNVCTASDIEALLKDRITPNFVYRPPEDAPFSCSESYGAMQMDNCIEELSQDPSGKLLQGEW